MNTHPSFISFFSFFYHSHSIHILSQSSFSYHSILSTLIFIPSSLYHSSSISSFTSYTFFIIELVIEEVRTIPSIHSFTIHSHPSLSLHSSFHQPSLLTHFLFIPFHHSRTHVISLHSSITLHFHFHYHLTISHSSL